LNIKRTLGLFLFGCWWASLVGCSSYVDQDTQVHARLFPWITSDLFSEIRYGFRLQPVERPEINWQIKVYQRHQKQLMHMLQKSGPVLFYLYQQVERRHLPTELVLLPYVESAYHPFAYSFAGAAGIWQMMPGTATGFGVKINWWYDGRRDIAASTDAALNYLTYLYHYFHNNWLLAIAAYDAGEGRVKEAILANKKHHKPIDFWSLDLPQETQEYVPKLIALKKIINNPRAFSVRIPDLAAHPYVGAVNVRHQMQFHTLAKLAKIPLTQLKQLNPGYRRWALPPQGPFTLLLPRNKVQPFIQALAQYEQHKPLEKPHWLRYRVAEKDSLSKIAKHFKHTAVKDIMKMNHKGNSMIKVGETLLIPVAHHVKHLGQRVSIINEDRLPGPKRVMYQVRPHDTLAKIAHKFNVTIHALRFWNKLTRRRPLKVRQRLIIWQKKHVVRPGSRRYQVRHGDTLSGIAVKFNTSMAKIRMMNHLKGTVVHLHQYLMV
jgi:membrane-bound lytic murein transglycosylase D